MIKTRNDELKKENDMRQDIDTLPVVALVAGSGLLPERVYKALRKKNHKVVVIAIKGQTTLSHGNPFDFVTPILSIELGQMKPVLSFLKQHNVSLITFAGGVRRPSVKELSLDWTGSRWLAQIGRSFFQGDDALLTKIVSLMEKEGLEICAPHTFLSDIFLPQGVHGQSIPTEDALNDIAIAKDYLITVSRFDVGQSLIIDGGRILSFEGIEGTQHMIARTKDYLGDSFTKPYGIFVKMKKHNQNEKIDMPTIGIETITEAIATNLKGIAIEANAVQVLDSEDIIKMANEAGFFLYAF